MSLVGSLQTTLSSYIALWCTAALARYFGLLETFFRVDLNYGIIAAIFHTWPSIFCAEEE